MLTQLVESVKGDFDILRAIGLLHDAMTPADLYFFDLPITVKTDELVYERLLASYNEGDATLAKELAAVEGYPEDIRRGNIATATPEQDFIDVINEMTPKEKAAVRARVLAGDGWQKWAASKK
jgi:hypothetical protein